MKNQFLSICCYIFDTVCSNAFGLKSSEVRKKVYDGVDEQDMIQNIRIGIKSVMVHKLRTRE